MASVLGLKGTKQILLNLQGAESKISNAISRGLKRGGLFLQRESQRIVPVDEGNLRGSAFTRKIGSGKRTDVIVGYTALYAVFVHEDLEARHGAEFNEAYGETEEKLRGPNQEAKFLEKPAKEKRTEILAIVANEAGNI